LFAVFSFVPYLVLMLNSKTTEIAKVDPDERMTRARAKVGLEPLSTHRVVTIVPERFRKSSTEQGGHHRSPMLHWRRSHVREFKAPSGAVYKRTVVARHLVGRRDLGEISHEYVVKHETKTPDKE
jgi:hypothetical protein